MQALPAVKGQQKKPSSQVNRNLTLLRAIPFYN